MIYKYFFKKLHQEIVKVCARFKLMSMLEFSCETTEQRIGRHAQQKVSWLEHETIYLNDVTTSHSKSFQDQSFDVSLVRFVLHTQKQQEQKKIIAEMRHRAAHILLIEYVLPERNLDIPACIAARTAEHLQGKKSYASFKDYMYHGALQGLIYSQGLEVEHRQRVLWGAANLILCKA